MSICVNPRLQKVRVNSWLFFSVVSALSVAEEFWGRSSLWLKQNAVLICVNPRQSVSNQSVLVSTKKVRLNQCLCQSASEKFVSIRVNSWLIFSVPSMAKEFLVLGQKAESSINPSTPPLILKSTILKALHKYIRIYLYG